MTAKVFNIFANLETEFLEAKKSLKDVDESIRKITGREPTLDERAPKGQSANGRSRAATASFGGNSFSTAISQIEDQSDEPQRKRRFTGTGFGRLRADPREINNYDDYDDLPVRKLQSSVIATTREVKPRTQALEEQKNDKKSLARNKRMFGMILGTLQKFQNEESGRKDTQSQKRVEIEKKLDEKAEEERSQLKIERKKLFLDRREKEAQIRRIEHKMGRVEVHQEWERSHQHLSNFIQTKTKPNIFYLPAKHTPETEKRLSETKDKYRLIVAEKRAKVQKELSEIDELYKKEEQNMRDEDMEEGETRSVNAKENSTDSKTVAINDRQITVETNNNSNNIIISDVNIKTEVSNEIMTDTSSATAAATEDTSNGVKSESVEHMETTETLEDIIEDKEFEPIYDE